MEKLLKEQSSVPILSKLKKSDIEYYLFFIIMECGEAFNIGSSNKIFLAFAMLGILFFIYKFAATKYNYKELFIVIALGILGILIYYSTKKAGGILSIMAIMGLKDVDIKKLFKFSLYIRITSFFLLMSLTVFHIIQNTRITNIRGNDTIIRYSMGFSHPNQFHLAYIIILLLCIYIYYDKLGFMHITLLGVINILAYTKSFSRTSAFIGFLAIFMLIWFKSIYFMKLKHVICIGIIPFGFLISLIPALLYNKIPNLRTIDSILQWRITFSKHYLESYPLKLFGNNLSGDSIVLDNGYVELVINYGLFFTFLYVTAYMILSYRCVKRRMYPELLLIVCLSIYGITEAFIPNLFVNISIIFFGELIFNNYKKQRGYHFES